MGTKIFLAALVFCFATSLHFPGSAQPWENGKENLIGKTFPNGSQMGFAHLVGGVLFHRDYRPWMWDDQMEEYPYIIDKGICITLLSTDSENPRKAANFHIFLIRIDRDTDTIEVFDELDIDRNSDDEYLYEEVRYTHNGHDHHHEALIRVDPGTDKIKQWFVIDIENMCFVPTEPLPGMEVVWQDP